MMAMGKAQIESNEKSYELSDYRLKNNIKGASPFEVMMSIRGVIGARLTYLNAVRELTSRSYGCSSWWRGGLQGIDNASIGAPTGPSAIAQANGLGNRGRSNGSPTGRNGRHHATITRFCFGAFVFSTKNREPWIRPEIESELHPYMATVCRNLDCPTLALDGTEDHVHILLRLGRKSRSPTLWKR